MGFRRDINGRKGTVNSLILTNSSLGVLYAAFIALREKKQQAKSRRGFI